MKEREREVHLIMSGCWEGLIDGEGVATHTAHHHTKNSKKWSRVPDLVPK